MIHLITFYDEYMAINWYQRKLVDTIQIFGEFDLVEMSNRPALMLMKSVIISILPCQK